MNKTDIQAIELSFISHDKREEVQSLIKDLGLSVIQTSMSNSLYNTAFINLNKVAS